MARIKQSLFLAIFGVLIFFSCSSEAVSIEKRVRPYLSTAAWYPSSAAELTELLSNFFKKATPPKVSGRVIGLISPHAGLIYSGLCAAQGFKALSNSPGIKRVFLLGVAHRGNFYGAAVGNFTHESTPLGLIPIDTEITSKLAKEKLFTLDNELMQKEHSLENQLPFLQYMMAQEKNTDYKVIPILFGHVEATDIKKLAELIKKYASRDSLYIASSDFTHYGAAYGYTPFVKDIKENLTTLDMGMVDKIKQGELSSYVAYQKKTGITMCGFIPVGVLLQILAAQPHTVELSAYYKSADSTNDYSFSVSYVSMVFVEAAAAAGTTQVPPKSKTENKEKNMSTNTEHNPLHLSKTDEQTLLVLARQTLEKAFQGKSSASEEAAQKQFSQALMEKAGVFVTLRESGDLRGCIGSIVGVEPLWEGVQNNALNAAFHDPRFMPLAKNELKNVDIEISVMTPLQQIADYHSIRLGIDGVIIRKGPYQSVFLPQVATETGWNLDEFLSHLCVKAGLPAQAYRSPGMEFMIFQALVFGEKEE